MICQENILNSPKKEKMRDYKEERAFKK